MSDPRVGGLPPQPLGHPTDPAGHPPAHVPPERLGGPDQTLDPDVGARRVNPAPVADERSIGEIMSDLTANVSVLMRQEVALAKAEVKQTAVRAGKGAGLLGGAGVAAHIALIFGSLALWWGLAHLIGGDADPAFGWSFLIVFVLWVIIAAILALVGRSQFEQAEGLPQTADTVSKIPNALKGDEEKNR